MSSVEDHSCGVVGHVGITNEVHPDPKLERNVSETPSGNENNWGHEGAADNFLPPYPSQSVSEDQTRSSLSRFLPKNPPNYGQNSAPLYDAVADFSSAQVYVSSGASMSEQRGYQPPQPPGSKAKAPFDNLMHLISERDVGFDYGGFDDAGKNASGEPPGFFADESPGFSANEPPGFSANEPLGFSANEPPGYSSAPSGHAPPLGSLNYPGQQVDILASYKASLMMVSAELSGPERAVVYNAHFCCPRLRRRHTTPLTPTTAV